MRLVLFANNRVGWQIASRLQAAGENIVAMVLHPEERRRYGAELLAATSLPPERIFAAERLHEPEVMAALAALQPELGLSLFFGYRLRPDLLARFPNGVINLHPALLPYNRGAHPNVWTLVDGTPAGVTLHYVDADIDTGDIIAQQVVPVEPVDTGQTLYHKLETACIDLFTDTWPRLRRGEVVRQPQDPAAGTQHRVRDLATLDALDLDRTYTGREWLNLLRARTFPPHAGAWFCEDGRRVQVRVELTYADGEDACDDAGSGD
jgi:methionyl-tRNA formyltransferase